MKLISLLLSIVSFTVTNICNAAESSSIKIKGKIEGASKYSITINANKRSFSTKEFLINTVKNDFYQLKISADGFYPAVQTFSHHELSQNDFSIPTISLVKTKQGRVMLAFGGDVMMGRRYVKPHLNESVLIRDGFEEEDTKKIVTQIKPYMELADYAAVNLETQISEKTPTERAPKSVTFFSPPETLGALQWAGVDYVTLGNNHVYDYLDEGLISTLKHLNDYQMSYSGAGLNQQEALKPHQTTINQQDYSMLGFVGWEGGFTPTQTATEIKGGSALGSKANIIKTVSKESELNRATVVQYHGSLEYTDEPTAMTESRLKTAVDHGADVVVAHHPHVTQGFELYKGKLIAYSMGNFIFDQYFHSTPHTFVLYVWMDGEEFHRAEIVPVYIKGYMPIPATGPERHTITKRTNYLSQLRGLSSELSGGHLVLTARDLNEKENQTITFNEGQILQPLYDFPVNGEVTSVTSSEDMVTTNRYRLGRNLINGGDFETYDSFDSKERGWFLENAEITEKVSFDGDHALQLAVESGVAKAGMKTFRRVFKAGNPMSYQASLLTNKKVKAKLYFQRRKSRDKFSKAFENEHVLLSEKIIEAGSNWQKVNFDFNTPRVGYRSYRIWLEVEVLDESNTEKEDNLIYLDQVALVQWQAHYNDFNSLPRDKEILGLSTYLGLENPAKGQVQVELEYH